ncbi:AAA family ATPase [Lysinibacillus xylanilyticus]|uniref:AAA family ATPase n=1 Tax=Lysinibacillus xylanilyticus TaxID=582475 RepID=UPI003D01C5A6
MDRHDDFYISKFVIYGLFNEKKVEIDFTKKIQIFIGENGVGKTTILNIIYNALNLNFPLLKELPFDLIQIFFKNEKSLILKKTWINDNETKNGDKFFINEDFKKYTTKKIIQTLKIDTETKIFQEKGRVVSKHSTEPEHEEILNQIDSLSLDLLAHPVSEEDLFDEYLIGNDDIEAFYLSKIKSFIKEPEIRFNLFCYIISNFLKDNIIYFPTYRRIEEELSKISATENIWVDYDETIEKRGLISFGLTDVEALLENIEKDIKEFNLEGYAQINGQLLSYMLSPDPITPEMLEKVQDKKAVEIVLDRIEEKALSEYEKELIKEKIKNINFFDIESSTDSVIIYFICKLIERYEMKSEQEDAIKTFVKVCNRYFVNKEFFYNQSRIKVEMLSKESKKEIKLKNLSSGEKQIISTFAKIYLKENKQENLIIFDEPELSLSVEWQSMFLPDILDSGKCQRLLAVTHSPFIYNNVLRPHASSLENLISTMKL